MYTRREIEYFANLGEILGYYAFVEDTKPNIKFGRSRPMDLAWWKFDEKIDKDNFAYLVLHLERENVFNKDVETIDKLFAMTDEDYIPQNVIGIQNLNDKTRIGKLNELVIKKNKAQKSNVLMVYRFYDQEKDFDRVWAYYFEPDKSTIERKAICVTDKSSCWYMVLEELYQE